MAEYNVQINKYDATEAGYDQLYPQPMKHADTHLLNGSDPIQVSGLGVSNPNLLDNWYFGNPVDQRGGVITTPETKAYTDEALTNYVGPANEHYNVTKLNSSVGTYTATDSSVWYVSLSECVRGYTGARYSIDRFWAAQPNVTILIEDGGLSFVGTDWAQRIENARIPLNTDLTYSVLTADNKLGSLTFQFDGTLNQTFIQMLGDTGIDANFIYNWTGTGNTPFFLQANNGAVKIKAVKLELGSQQTLAHQKNGEWVLNEIPNYAETLAKCQRYFVNLNPFNTYWTAYSLAIAGGPTVAYGIVNLTVPMRANPALVWSGRSTVCLSQDSDIPVVDITVSTETISATGMQLAFFVDSGLTTNTPYRVQGLGNSYSYIWLDANL